LRLLSERKGKVGRRRISFKFPTPLIERGGGGWAVISAKGSTLRE